MPRRQAVISGWIGLLGLVLAASCYEAEGTKGIVGTSDASQGGTSAAGGASGAGGGQGTGGASASGGSTATGGDVGGGTGTATGGGGSAGGGGSSGSAGADSGAGGRGDGPAGGGGSAGSGGNGGRGGQAGRDAAAGGGNGGRDAGTGGTAGPRGGSGGSISRTGGSGGAAPRGGSGGGTARGGTTGTSTTPDSCRVSSVPDDVRSSYKIHTFYQKYASANGIVIATSSEVGDDAIVRDCTLLLDMYSKRDELRRAIISQKVFFTLIAESEQLSSLPEIGPVYGTSLDERARGLGSMTPTICAEDSIMCMRGDPWVGDCICPHEYGHTFADIAIARGDPALASQLKTIYNNIVASGRLANAYVHQDGGTSGLMAWGVQAWYDCAIDGTNGGYHSDINTRAELEKELPEFYEFLTQILPEDSQYQDCYANP
ncbi:MAG: hypothetical protein JXP73_18415 [Deltaproteobacteria bacterium]|nr:hypothetical protein [Deltaproteobacteria bacterium]